MVDWRWWAQEIGSKCWDPAGWKAMPFTRKPLQKVPLDLAERGAGNTGSHMVAMCSLQCGISQL